MIYEYACEACDSVVDVEMSLSEMLQRSTIECETCGAQMKRQISQSTFMLKGGGWANEGYCKSQKKEEK